MAGIFWNALENVRIVPKHQKIKLFEIEDQKTTLFETEEPHHHGWWKFAIADVDIYHSNECLVDIIVYFSESNVEKWLLLYLWFFLVWSSVKVVLKYFTLLYNFAYENIWESV